MIFYLGTHKAIWLERTAVPLFLSRRTLAVRKSLPRAAGPWALDSGGFTELSSTGRWSLTVDEYAEEVARYREEIGGLTWAAPMDFMCEPSIVEQTGLSVREHQHRTIENYLALQGRISRFVPCEDCAGSGSTECGALYPGGCTNESCHGHCEEPCPVCTGEGMVDRSLFPPVLQGWVLSDYLEHAAMYLDAGIDLTSEPLVAVGSVCRRGQDAEIVAILRELHGCGFLIHAFGVRGRALRSCADFLHSADSMAWSYAARRGNPLPGCTHKRCQNCLHYAIAWRERLVEQLGLFGGSYEASRVR